MNVDSSLPGFRTLSPAQRLARIAEKIGLNADETAHIGVENALPLETANGMIENVIGKFELPYAVAGYFQVNGRDVIVPMAVEEPSVVAAASFMAKLRSEEHTSELQSLMRISYAVFCLKKKNNINI